MFTNFYSVFRKKAIKKINLRHKLLNKHVYLQPVITSDNKTKVFICIDNVKIMQVSDVVYSDGNIPACLCKDADKIVDYLKRQYYLANRRTMLMSR